MAKKGSKRGKKSGGKKKLKPADLPELIHSLVEKGARSAEEIHRQVADLPVKVLEGIMPATAKNVGKIQHRSIGAVYQTIREINDEVERLAVDILDEASKVEGQVRQSAAAARKKVTAAARKTTKKSTPRRKTAAKKSGTKRTTKRRARS
jgi:hypothetical protein